MGRDTLFNSLLGGSRRPLEHFDQAGLASPSQIPSPPKIRQQRSLDHRRFFFIQLILFVMTILSQDVSKAVHQAEGDIRHCLVCYDGTSVGLVSIEWDSKVSLCLLS